MGSVLFIIWRESLEALLVVGILYAWISKNKESKIAKMFIWIGVISGIFVALLLALIIFKASNFMGNYGQVFTVGMVLIASCLIVQMVLWLKKNAKNMKGNLEAELSKKNLYGIALLCGIAVAREGSETVVFLYSTLVNSHDSMLNLSIGGIFGLLAAILTFYLMQIGKKISWRLFFKITEIMLLFLGCSLFLKGFESITNYFAENTDYIPLFLLNNLWNTSNFMSDSSQIGSFFSSIFAYRAMPSLLSLIIFIIYWIIVFILLKRQKTIS